VVNAILVEFVSNVGGAMVVVTGLAAGLARTWAVLVQASNERVERMTAVGFVAGIVVMLFIVCIDSTLEQQ
jgi:hypothetical protein